MDTVRLSQLETIIKFSPRPAVAASARVERLKLYGYPVSKVHMAMAQLGFPVGNSAFRAALDREIWTPTPEQEAALSKLEAYWVDDARVEGERGAMEADYESRCRTMAGGRGILITVEGPCRLVVTLSRGKQRIFATWKGMWLLCLQVKRRDDERQFTRSGKRKSPQVAATESR